MMLFSVILNLIILGYFENEYSKEYNNKDDVHLYPRLDGEYDLVRELAELNLVLEE